MRCAAAYGIFEGRADQTAKLRFTPRAGRWIADELWHADQRVESAPDGTLLLYVPYRDATELAMDVLRYGPDVEVLAPAALRRAVAAAHARAAAQYGEALPEVLSRAS